MISGPAAAYADSMDSYFGAVYGVNAFDLNSAAYESLKSHGLTLISDRALRSAIALVYERALAEIDRLVEVIGRESNP